MWREYFVYGLTKSLTAGTGVTFETSVIRIDSDADFEFQKTAYQATNGNIRIKYRDDTMGRFLIKSDVDLRNVGSNFIGTPFIWPRPYMILAGSTFTVEAADASGLANNLRLALHGAKLRPGNPPWAKKFRAAVPFIYPSGKQTIPASSTASVRIEVDNDAHFLVQKLTGFASGSNLVEIKEGSRDRDWFNIALHFNDIFGNGQFPNSLFANRFIYRGSVIIVQVQNLEAISIDVEMDLIGTKLYE